jgi:hypothetical protein
VKGGVGCAALAPFPLPVLLGTKAATGLRPLQRVLLRSIRLPRSRFMLRKDLVPTLLCARCSHRSLLLCCHRLLNGRHDHETIEPDFKALVMGRLALQPGWKLKMLTRVATLVLVFGLTFAERAEAQTAKPTSEQKTPVVTSQQPEDPLGRDTPRSAVMTFEAIQKEDYERARSIWNQIKLQNGRNWLETGVIFDRKLSVRLSALSDKPDGILMMAFGKPGSPGHHSERFGQCGCSAGPRAAGKGPPDLVVFRRACRKCPGSMTKSKIWFERYVPSCFASGGCFPSALPVDRGLLGLPLILGLASILTRILTAFLRPLLRRLTRNRTIAD